MVLELYTKELESLTTFEKLVRAGKMAREEEDLANAKLLIKGIAQEAIANNLGDLNNITNIAGVILKRIAEIDKTLSDYSNEVLHHPEFQKSEAAWRGLHKFVVEAETSDKLKIFVFPTRKSELLKDFETAIDFDQSAMFKKVYEEEYGTYGGTPFSMFIADFYFSKTPKDIALMEGLSGVCAAAHTPLIAGVNPELFGMDSFLELPNPLDLKSLFNTADFLRWNAFRSRDDSKYISLALPRVMQREVYGKGYLEIEDFQFEETISGENHDYYLWGNAAYAMGLRITNAFNLYSWCAAIRGVEGGGLVENLPVHTYTVPSGEKLIKCPTEIVITDRREKELSDLGFMALCYKKYTNNSVFFDCPTIAKTKDYEDPLASANAYVAVQLGYLLAASRFAHYLKVIMRDKIGIFSSKEDVSALLNGWINRYVTLQNPAPFYVKASFPLSEGRVDVYDIPGKVGCYKAICFLKPHFQLNDITISIRMVAELPAPSAS